MATTSNIKNPQSCPVAALADEAQKLINAHIALDDTPAEASDMRENNSRSKMGVVWDVLMLTNERATWLEAKSAKGALFQLCAIADYASTLDGNDDSEKVMRSIKRLLYSVAGYIEQTSSDGVRLSDACGEFYLYQQYNEHKHLADALMQAEAQAIAAE